DGILFASQILVNNLGGNGNGSDLWHYVSPMEREYGIVTTKESVAWVEVTDPFNPSVIHIHDRGNTSSLWGDVKTVGDHAYVDGEGGGVLVFDMTEIDSGNVAFVGNVGPGRGHNIVACEELGLLARCGPSFRIYSVAEDPTDLVLLGERPDRYVHDANLILYPDDGPDEAYRGHVIGFLSDGFNSGGTDTGLSIVDFGMPGAMNPAGDLISRVTWEDAGYSHQSTLSEDLAWVFSNDETRNHSTWQCFQITDLDAPAAGDWQSNGQGSNNHNSFVLGDRLFAANYTTGVRILECDGGELSEVASFDTYPASDSTGYQGCWGVDPFLPSGTILASDMQSGLFVLRLEEPVDETPAFGFPGGLPDRVGSDGLQLVVDVEGFEATSLTMTYEAESGAFGVIEGVQGSEPRRFVVDFPVVVDCPDEILYTFSARAGGGQNFFDPDGPYTASYADTEVIAIGYDGADSTN
ncbi:MAG: choice-of-anchor B family protein, partial [Phycisphaera sp.]|nr:choice-of-anchor B family protein [Phycisphaera sp.]